MDDHRNIVDMGMNAVSAQTADVLGEREHANMHEDDERLPDLRGWTRTMDTDNSCLCLGCTAFWTVRLLKTLTLDRR